MKLEDFIMINTQLKAKFGIGLDELHLLSFIVNEWKDKVVTITLLLDKYSDASPATTHKRLDGLLSSKVLTKTLDAHDARIKILQQGKNFNELVKFLKGI